MFQGLTVNKAQLPAPSPIQQAYSVLGSSIQKPGKRVDSLISTSCRAVRDRMAKAERFDKVASLPTLYIEHRRNLIDMLCTATSKLELELSTAHVAVGYLDKIAAMYIHDPRWIVVPATCLMLAVKWEEKTCETDYEKLPDVDMLSAIVLEWTIDGGGIGSPLGTGSGLGMEHISQAEFNEKVDWMARVLFSNDMVLYRPLLDLAKESREQVFLYLEGYLTAFADMCLQATELYSTPSHLLSAGMVIATRKALNIAPLWNPLLEPVIGLPAAVVLPIAHTIWELYKVEYPDRAASSEAKEKEASEFARLRASSVPDGMGSARDVARDSTTAHASAAQHRSVHSSTVSSGMGEGAPAATPVRVAPTDAARLGLVSPTDMVIPLLGASSLNDSGSTVTATLASSNASTALTASSASGGYTSGYSSGLHGDSYALASSGRSMWGGASTGDAALGRHVDAPDGAGITADHGNPVATNSIYSSVAASSFGVLSSGKTSRQAHDAHAPSSFGVPLPAAIANLGVRASDFAAAGGRDMELERALSRSAVHGLVGSGVSVPGAGGVGACAGTVVGGSLMAALLSGSTHSKSGSGSGYGRIAQDGATHFAGSSSGSSSGQVRHQAIGGLLHTSGSGVGQGLQQGTYGDPEESNSGGCLDRSRDRLVRPRID